MLALDVTKDWKVQRRRKDVSFKRQQLFETTWDRGALINLPLLLATLASMVYCTQGYVLPPLFHVGTCFHSDMGSCFHSATATQKPPEASPYLHPELQACSQLQSSFSLLLSASPQQCTQLSILLKLICLSHRVILCPSLPAVEGVPRTQDFWC